MPDDISNDILYAAEKGKADYIDYRTNRLVLKNVRISETIHRSNTKTMKAINVIQKKSVKSIIKEKNITEKLLDVARERGLSNDDLLEYDITCSPLLFNSEGMMTTVTPNKSQLVTEMEKKTFKS